jgi:hypothetical protein
VSLGGLSASQHARDRLGPPLPPTLRSGNPIGVEPISDGLQRLVACALAHDARHDLIGHGARPSESDALRALGGKCLFGALTDQPALELGEGRQEVRHWHPEVVQATEYGDTLLAKVRLAGRGASSGLEIEQTVWLVSSYRDGKLFWWHG